MKTQAHGPPVFSVSSKFPVEADVTYPFGQAVMHVETLDHELNELLVNYETMLERGGVRGEVEMLARWLGTYLQGLLAAHKISQNSAFWLLTSSKNLQLVADRLQRLESGGYSVSVNGEEVERVGELFEAVYYVNGILPDIQQFFYKEVERLGTSGGYFMKTDARKRFEFVPGRVLAGVGVTDYFQQAMMQVEDLIHELNKLLVRHETGLKQVGIRHEVETLWRWLETYRHGLSVAHEISQNGTYWLCTFRNKLQLAAGELQRLEDEGGSVSATSEQIKETEELLRVVCRIDKILPSIQHLFCSEEEEKSHHCYT